MISKSPYIDLPSWFVKEECQHHWNGLPVKEATLILGASWCYKLQIEIIETKGDREAGGWVGGSVWDRISGGVSIISRISTPPPWNKTTRWY